MPKVTLATLLFVLAGLGCQEANPFASTLDEEAAGEVETFVGLVNAHRTSVGCAPLEWHIQVATVAQRHSEDMVDRNYFGHTNPDGSSPFDRLGEADISFVRAGENIAAGQPTAEDVLTAWLNSDGHRANIENCGYTHHGLGLDERRWTHLFVTPS